MIILNKHPNMAMHPLVKGITQEYKGYADATKAAGAKAYLLNQFDFFGIPAPLRRTLDKVYLKQYKIETIKEVETVVKELWRLPEREYQYFAVEVFAFYKKLWRAASVKLMEHCLIHKSWWDSVDAIASDWTGPYFKLHPKQIAAITLKWNESSDMWLQRSSIMFQKAYKKDTDTLLLSKYILNCTPAKEFFIQKAIGWSLGEYSKSNPEWVKKFVLQNKLSTLAEREALKRIAKEV